MQRQDWRHSVLQSESLSSTHFQIVDLNILLLWRQWLTTPTLLRPQKSPQYKHKWILQSEACEVTGQDCHWVRSSRSYRLIRKICVRSSKWTQDWTTCFFYPMKGHCECVLVTTFIKFQFYVYADQFRTCFVWSCVVKVSFAMQMQSEIDGSEENKNLHISKHLMLKAWCMVYVSKSPSQWK